MTNKTNRKNTQNTSNDASGRAATTLSIANKRHKTSSLSSDRNDVLLGTNEDVDSKRIMSIHDSNDDNERQQQLAPNTESISSSKPAPPPPKYGSISYWDDRYQKQFSLLAQTTASSTEVAALGRAQQRDRCNDIVGSSSSDRKDDDDANGTDVTTLPYHSWYFTYDELRPILLPLLLGESISQDVVLDEPNEKIEINEQEGNDGSDDHQDDDEEEIPKGIERGAEHLDENDKDEDGDLEECDEDDGEWEEVADEDDEKEGSDINSDDDSDDEVPVREGLAKDGPVSVLEIGCGDVPLGAGLAVEFGNLAATILQNKTAVAAVNDDDTTTSNLSIIARIICTDYSPVVVDMMKRQYDIAGSSTTELASDAEKVKATDENEISPSDVSNLLDKGSLAPIQFEVADARNLPYDDSTFHMVLEKGTLDAVLSDTANGITDCAQIISECARVTRGCIVIVSHLNAHTPNGLGWLEEVVMEGLKKYSVRPTSDAVSWEIEVHGNAEVDDDNEDFDVEKSSASAGAIGPAVYVIHKMMKHSAEPSTSKEISGSSKQPSSTQQQRSEVASTTGTSSVSTISIVTENGTIKSLDDDVVDIVPINVRFFSY